jgi:predicted RNA methylase
LSLSKKLDQFYTNPIIASLCYGLIREIINIDNFFLFEPSAGTGSFSNLFHENSMACDLDPKMDYIKEMNFFELDVSIFEDKRVITVGNPPFGKNSSLAIDFFNRSALFSKFIAFVVPKTFKKLSVRNRLSFDFHLIYEFDLPKDSFIFEDKAYDVPCTFQIWEKRVEKREKVLPIHKTKFFEFVNKENADFAIRRIGGLAGKVLEDFDKYKDSSHYYIKSMIKKEELVFILKSLYKEFNLIAKNSAGNPSLSKNELIEIFEKKYCG